MSNSILVTGGLGFVGSNLVDKLINLGFRVDVIDNLSSLSSSKDYCNSKANYFFSNVLNISETLEGHRYDRIFHLAAEARIQPSFENPVKWFESNALATMKVMDFANKSNSGIVVYATTSSKNHGSHYISPYTYSKVVGEGVLKMYSECYSTNCAMATFYNVYGYREPDLNNSHVLPALIRKFHEAKIAGKDVVEIWGSGTPMREFLYVDDLADACLHLMKTYNDSEIVNIGTGVDISIKDLAYLIRDIVGFSGGLSFNLDMPDGTLRKLLDVSKLKGLGWKYSTTLEEGIKKTYYDYIT